MKPRIIVAINVKGAGPSMIVNEFISNLLLTRSPEETRGLYIFLPDIPYFEYLKRSNQKNLQIRFTNSKSRNPIKRILEYAKISFLSYHLRTRASFIFGNYSPFPISGRKTVLLHHPHIVDNSLTQSLPIVPRLIEEARRILFRITLHSTDKVIVQSNYMLKSYLSMFKHNNIESGILYNPLSSKFDKSKNQESTYKAEKENNIIYVSRYAPHKNHAFLFKIAISEAQQMRKTKTRFIVTIDPQLPGAQEFLDQTVKNGLSDLIVNIGEVEQAALIIHYQKSKALIFPSKSETFGNPLIEAMHYGLPVIAPDHHYAHSICGHAGLYYNPEDPTNAWQHIQKIVCNEEYRTNQRESSLLQSQKYPSTTQWTKHILKNCDSKTKYSTI